MIAVRTCLYRSRHGMSRVWLIAIPLFGLWQQVVMLRSQFAMSFFAPSAANADVTFDLYAHVRRRTWRYMTRRELR